MSEDRPSGDPEQPRYGEYAPPGWTQPPQPEAWVQPPPEPGLIPLRPLLLADVIVGAFKVIRRNPKPTFWFSLGISFVTSLAAVVLIGLVLWNVLPTMDPTVTPDLATVRGLIVLIVVTALLALLIQIILTALPRAIVIREVTRATLGERRTLRELWTDTRGRMGALIGWSLIFGGTIAVVALLTMLGLAEYALSGGLGAAIAAVGFGILAGIAILALAVWIGTKLAFVPSLIVIERLPIAAALRRSWAMTAGSFWRILGITLLVQLIVQAAAQIISMPITFVSGIVNQTQVAGSLDARAITVVIVTLVVQVIITAVMIVIQASVPTLLYLDARMRREGLDIVLRSAADERGSGRVPTDPFD